VQLRHPQVETSFDTEPKLFLAPGVGADYIARIAGCRDLGRKARLLFTMCDCVVMLLYQRTADFSCFA
jgi:hypothetical protein